MSFQLQGTIYPLSAVPTSGLTLNAYKAARFTQAPTTNSPAPSDGLGIDGTAVIAPYPAASTSLSATFNVTVPTFENYYISWSDPNDPNLYWWL